ALDARRHVLHHLKVLAVARHVRRRDGRVRQQQTCGRDGHCSLNHDRPPCCTEAWGKRGASDFRPDSRDQCGPCPAKATPRPYVIAVSMMPTTVISRPLAHQARVVMSAFDAPTRKCATVLMMNEAITAGIPTVKKNGMIGMKPPTAVESEAEMV